jgi:uncharacterized protein YbjT (DUF2867 family)
MGNIALLAGATGLVGSHCLQQLLEDDFFEMVKVLTRRPMQKEHHKLIEIVVDFDELESFRLQMEATHTFCSLGTTIKKAGSQQAFKLVDYEYPLRLGAIMQSLSCPSFSVVTALGAKASSPIFYNRVKGELERDLEAFGFPSLQILQPSLILGERQERRMGEGLAQAFFKVTKPIWMGPLKEVAGIEAEQIAKAAIHFAKLSEPGCHRYTSGVLQDV